MRTAQTLAWTAVLLVLFAPQIGCELPPGERRTFKSPDGRYVVEASGRFTIPPVPIIENVVRFDVRRDGSTLVQGRMVTSADFFDKGFDTKYGPPNWVAPRVLRFPARVQAPFSDAVVVRSLSGSNLQYVEIVTHDVLLLLDLPAGAEMELPVTSQQHFLTFVRAAVIREGAKPVSTQDDFHREPGETSVKVGVAIHAGRVELELLKTR